MPSWGMENDLESAAEKQFGPRWPLHKRASRAMHNLRDDNRLPEQMSEMTNGTPNDAYHPSRVSNCPSQGSL